MTSYSSHGNASYISRFKGIKKTVIDKVDKESINSLLINYRDVITEVVDSSLFISIFEGSVIKIASETVVGNDRRSGCVHVTVCDRKSYRNDLEWVEDVVVKHNQMKSLRFGNWVSTNKKKITEYIQDVAMDLPLDSGCSEYMARCLRYGSALLSDSEEYTIIESRTRRNPDQTLYLMINSRDDERIEDINSRSIGECIDASVKKFKVVFDEKGEQTTVAYLASNQKIVEDVVCDIMRQFDVLVGVYIDHIPLEHLNEHI